MKKTRWLFLMFVIILIAALALASCKPAGPADDTSGAEPEEEASEPAEEEPMEGEPVEEEEPAEEEAMEEEGPQVGGTFVLAFVEEPDTLDIYKSSFAIASAVTDTFGGALVAKTVEGQHVPSLATGWEVSDDGLVWTFTLRDDVKFHSGDPLTANDFVWTWDRCRDEDFVCPVSEGILGPIATYEAVDDYTLVLTLNEPYYPMLESLTAASYLQPLNQRVVEEAGDQYGWTVAESVGPFMFKEWVQDEKIILERNPDFTWGAEYFEGANPGPYHIETVEFRFLPDYSTVLAGVEAGELSYAAIEPKDLETVENTGAYHIYESVASHFCYVQFNFQDPLFQDLAVRQAMNLAVDQEAILQVVRQGQAIVLEGPLHEGFIGYDAESMSGTQYGYDLEAAKALLEDAGYTYDDDGMLLTPDGDPFTFELLGTPEEADVKIMQMLIDMWGQLGMTVEIQQLEWGTMAPIVFGGEYQMSTMCIGWPEADIMYMMYHSANIGGINFAYYEDETLDGLLMDTRTKTDPAERQAAVNDAYTYIVDNNLMVPTLGTVSFQAVHNDFQGIEFSSYTGILLSNAYYAGE